jgi:quercetin dioxygenase-like cupin family protein
MMHVVSGEFQFELDDKSTICKAGDIVVIPSNVPHFGKALTDCQLMDVFTPARDEYR